MPDEVIVDHKHEALSQGEKCGMCDYAMAEPYKPFGGAISFAEMEQWSISQAMAEYANEVTYRFQSLMNNIMNGEMTPAEKAAAATALTKELSERITSPDNEEIDEEKWEVLEGKEHKSFWAKLLHRGKSNKPRDLPAVELPPNRGFKVYRDQEGDLRWLSLSSNAFEDLDKELFTTKALEEAIEHSDKTGERGPLLIYHVPSAEVGQCDYQAMAGRFLVESGKFLDTPLGRKAVEYFTNTDEEHQVSIGYEYRLGDEEDGIYEWTRIKERSVCPYGAAANPWTDFKIIGESPMDARKAETLEKIFGKELAAGVISSAEERTKELEATIRFKEVKEEPLTITVTGSTLDEMEASAKAAVTEAFEKAKKKMTPEEEAAMKKMEEAKKEADPVTVTVDVSSAAPSLSPEQFTQLAVLITDLSTQVESLNGLSETVKEIQTQIKELKTSDDEKISDIISPKWKLPNNGMRPTESNKNLITDEKAIKELTVEDDKPRDPAAAYVEDLLGGRTPVASN